MKYHYFPKQLEQEKPKIHWKIQLISKNRNQFVILLKMNDNLIDDFALIHPFSQVCMVMSLPTTYKPNYNNNMV